MTYPNKSGGGTPGPAGENGKPIRLQKSSGWVQWNYAGDSIWNNLIPLSEISGSDGRPVEMEVSGGYIKWRLEGDALWQNLVATSELKPDPNSLSIGTISTLNPGDQATADITGDSPSQILSLGIPSGAPGTNGSNGVGVSGSVVTYQGAASGTTAPTGTWQSTVPVVAKGQYLWSRTITNYTDSTSSTSYAVSYIALDGSPGGNGTNGTNGVGISGSVISYQTSASGTTTPSGTWLSSLPSVSKGQFLWVRTVVTMTDSSTSTAYSVSYSGNDGTNGISYTPQSPSPRTITVATAYQHTDLTKGYKVVVNARATQTVTLAGTVGDKLELRIGQTAAAVASGGSGGFSVGVWESGITGIAVMIGAAVADGGQLTAEVPAGWYFSVNRLAGTSATIVSCFTQSLTP